MADIEKLPAQTALRLLYSGPDGRSFDEPLGYAQLSRLHLHRHSRLFRVHSGASRLFLRQGARNRMFLTLREKNVTDGFVSGVKLALARAAAALLPRKSILLFEKKSSRYEESASVVFESLVDAGRDHVHFVLEGDAIEKVPEKYRPHVIKRFSFRHYYHFFAARTLIGTELVAHAMELRTANRLLLRRFRSPKLQYVFLQHGVMYMVALDSAQRSFFRAGPSFPKRSRIVVSSELEKQHFVELAKFKPSALYVCGLPKFDRASLGSDADRILIMPTWRPWEYNTIRTHPEESGYMRMVRDLYSAVPDELKDRVWILPHPLVREALEASSLADHLWVGDSYDAALRRAAMLITDYSSIAYDAFYRGARVVFWWKDKDECMQRYGGHLMLDEQTAFGPVCYDSAALRQAITSSVDTPRDEEYARRFGRIVEFHDGRNTERLIEMMKRDGFI